MLPAYSGGMTVENDLVAAAKQLRREQRAANAAGAIPQPDIGAGRTGSRIIVLMIATLAFASAGYAIMFSLPMLIAFCLAGLGGLAIYLSWRITHDDASLAVELGKSDERRREEIELLADRMWELQESEERLRGLVDALGDLVVHRDRDGKIVYASKIFADLFDREPRTLSGMTLDELGIDIGQLPDAGLAGAEMLSSCDVAIETKSGTRWFSWVELSVRDDITGLVSHRAIARDVTARKRAETELISQRQRAEVANDAKSRFLATVSHEIRTPMNGIMGLAKLLVDTELTPEQRTYVESVSSSADSLMALIEDLLDFSKIEAGRLDLALQPVSPRELVNNVVELLAARAYSKDIGLGCYISPDVPETINSDPGRLRQVLLNLAGNAIKFTETGGVLVAVTMQAAGDQPKFRVSISDTGPGLNSDDAVRIFGEFEQVDSSSTRKYGGAGLGLAISKRIASAMGGDITVESKPGEGATFHLDIPLQAGLNPTKPASTGLDKRRVLIVSENSIEADAIARTISAQCGACEITPDADSAQARLEAPDCAFNTILIDAALEKRNGDVLAKLLAACKNKVEPEAITLISPTDRGSLPEYRSAGYDTFLVRPVRGETLVGILSADKRKNRPVASMKPDDDSNRRNQSEAAPLSVLLVEDNPVNALLARVTLEKAGHNVHVAGDGQSALDIIFPEPDRFDVVLMDLHMPVLDGMDALVSIRAREEETGSPPLRILILSADSQESTRHSALAAGADGFVTKPLDPALLVTTVEERCAA